MVLMMLQGELLKEKKIEIIVNIRSSLNLGLSEVLNTSFPHTVPIPRPQKPTQEISHAK